MATPIPANYPSVKTPAILSIKPDGLNIVTLQTQPQQLSMVSNTSTHNVRGIDQMITFNGPPNTTETEVNISGYFTALIPFNSGSNVLKAVAGAEQLAILAVELGSGDTAAVLDIASSTINLAKGTYDLVTGLFKNNNIPASPLNLSTDAFYRIKLLHRAMEESIPCSLNWDIENYLFDKQKYIITNINVQAKQLQHAYKKDSANPDISQTNTLEVMLNMKFIKVGTRVIVK